jgi:hypothetical protein
VAEHEKFVAFVPKRNRPAPSATVARVEKEKVVVALAASKEIVLDLRTPGSFDVARSRQFEVTPGDKNSYPRQ